MKVKSSKKSRSDLANYLSAHLNSFGEKYEDIVVCPTCLGEFSVKADQEKFSAGHILPEVAGGQEWTFLCRSCNSRFGEKQDKWFGEYLHILNIPTGTFLDAKTKNKYISVNGEVVRGDISVRDDGSAEVFVPIDRNPPGKVKSIPKGPKLELSFKPVLIDHENEIEIGYITAAYLTWFHEIGYNWVFQSSLDVVRKQILECDRSLNGAKVIDLDFDKSPIEGVGAILQSDTLYPCCVVVDKLVIFPPPNKGKAPKEIKFVSPCSINFLKLAVMGEPYITLYDGYQVVVPNRLLKNPPIPKYLLNIKSGDNADPEWHSIVESDLKGISN
ncbi:MAG: HNH endonuclease [Bacteroidales bacterium]|nr:HNH endonuclease [Bacteroidales bacterium]